LDAVESEPKERTEYIVTNMRDSSESALIHLACIVGGPFVGAAWQQSEVGKRTKSVAEREDPEGVRAVCREASHALDEWQPDTSCECEDDFVDDLADWLDRNLDWDIEVRKSTHEGQPDIIIGDLLVLELKIDPCKSERDRCVGQVAGYSREWVSWIVLLDAPDTTVADIEELLNDKNLHGIQVWNFD
jgi:hypothetical protein